MLKMFLKYIIINLSLFSIIVQSKITCRDETTGNSVDWFTLYKLPRKTTIEETSIVNNPFIEYGTAYTFMTSESIEWQLSSLSFNDSQSFPGKTLDPLYDRSKSNIGYLLYNDQADKVSIVQGHTKGVILFDETSAIWIVHSIPHFPNHRSTFNYSIQPSQCVYGQSMLCMSLSIDKLEQVGQQLLYNYPQVYDSFIPDSLKSLNSISNLVKVINGDKIKTTPWFNLNVIETLGGEKLLSFAKFTKFNDDLYSGLVVQNLNSSLLTETWNNGRGTLDSNCTAKYQVHNVEQVKFDSFGVRFSVHRDHSKWAVTSGEQNKIACIGDINRQSEQFKRAGGTVCFINNVKVWNQYFKLVDQIEPCKTNPSYKRIRKRQQNTRKRNNLRKFKANDSLKNEFIILLR